MATAQLLPEHDFPSEPKPIRFQDFLEKRMREHKRWQQAETNRLVHEALEEAKDALRNCHRREQPMLLPFESGERTVRRGRIN